MQKQVNWDLIAFQLAIIKLVESHPTWRSSKYQHHTTAEFSLQNNIVTARAPGTISSLSHDGCFRFLCVLSCLWVIAWPLYTLMKKPSTNKLMAMWESVQPWQQAFSKNTALIYDLTGRRVKGMPMNAL